jgi:hypothetical protein
MNPLEYLDTPYVEAMHERATLEVEYSADHIAMLERELLHRTMGQLPLEGI